MRVLVVDDESGKRERVLTFIGQLPGVSVVEEAKSFQGAIERLTESAYDWVILDMRLTSFDVSAADDGGRPRNFGGDEVLRKMTRRGITSRVVVLTQYSIFRDERSFLSLDQLAAQFAAKYPSFVGLVQFQHSNNAWQDRLRSLLQGEGT